MVDLEDEGRILILAEAHIACTRDFDLTFRNRPNYFTQEFGYLLVGCFIADLQGSPLTVGVACQIMKSGSARTREERIKRAVDDGYLLKERDAADGRAALLRPTPALKVVLIEHFARTTEIMADAFKRMGVRI